MGPSSFEARPAEEAGRAPQDDGETHVFAAKTNRELEHNPEKWKPVFGKDHAQNKKLNFDPIQSNRIKV
jgi:hypothetical protein